MTHIRAVDSECIGKGLREWWDAFLRANWKLLWDRVGFERSKYWMSPDRSELMSDVCFFLWRYHREKVREAANPIGYVLRMSGMIVRQSVLTYVGFNRTKKRRGKVETYRSRGKRFDFKRIDIAQHGERPALLEDESVIDPARQFAIEECMRIACSVVWPCYRNRFASVRRICYGLLDGSSVRELANAGFPVSCKVV